MKTVIAGSREIDLQIVVDFAIKLAYLNEIDEIISGDAVGPDKLGAAWAEAREIPVKHFPPNYELYGSPRAQFKRNDDMAIYCDQAVIIWDGESNGTRHMMKCLRNHDKPFTLIQIKVDYEREAGTIVKLYRFANGTTFKEYPDGKYEKLN